MMGAVSLKNVKKAYGSQAVIHGVSLEIEKGEFVILVGPSGCGKSTLLRMIAGLESITSGTVSINGRVMNGVAPKDRDVAMVFQSYALYPHMTVEENMAFSLMLAGADRGSTSSRVQKVAESLGLTPYLKRYPRHLSGGQRQRVAMGRAMVRDPDVYLFDEPLSNLDAKLRTSMRTEIKLNQQRLGTTTIHVTHDQIEAMTMADRIVVMRDGHVEQIGPPLELYDRPANIFVAGFIGSPSMNLIEGRLSGGKFLAADGTAVAVTSPLPAASEGRPVTLGIRPEHLVADGDGEDAEIVAVEPTGAETQVVSRFAGAEVVGVFRERVAFAPGRRIKLKPIPDAVHFFDPRTGVRLAS